MTLVRRRLESPGPGARPGHAAVLRAVEAVAHRPCARCARGLCGHEAVLAVVAGMAGAPRCVRCFAEGLGLGEDALVARLRAQVARRPCHLAAWARATAGEPGCPVATAR